MSTTKTIRVTFDSECLTYIEYDRTTRVLTVEFRTGRTYKYHNVPYRIVDRMRRSRSVGRYFVKNVRTVFTYEEI